MLIQVSAVHSDPMMIIVTMPAPALSPAVTGVSGLWKLLGLLPALGLPLDVPPESSVTGTAASPMSSDDTAPTTFISWPAPVLPSYLPVFHLKPHCRPSAPPVHCLMAASVDVLRTGSTLGAMKGASCVMVEYQRWM